MRRRSGTREANLGYFGFWRTRLSGRLHSYVVSKLITCYVQPSKCLAYYMHVPQARACFSTVSSTV